MKTVSISPSQKLETLLLEGLQSGEPIDVTPAYMQQKRAEQKEIIESIRRGLEQMQRGEGRPAEEAFAEFRAKHSIPPR